MAEDTSVFVAGMSRKKLMIIAGIAMASVLLVGIIILIAVYSSKGSGSQIGEKLSASKCQSGRYYLGDVNGAFPEYAVATGIYVESTNKTVNKEVYWAQDPVYKHESRDFFLIKGYKGIKEYWRVHNGQKFGMELKAHRPDSASEVWSVRYGKDDDRAFMKNLKAVCVEASFVTCHGGKLWISGLDASVGDFLGSFMGAYELMNTLFNGRQVYRQEDDGKGYLFYDSHQEHWAIDNAPPDNNRDAEFIYTEETSNAIRPEYVVSSSWFAYDYNRQKPFLSQPIRFTCIETETSAAVSRVEPDLAVKRKDRLPFYYFNVKYCRLTPASQWCHDSELNYDCCSP